MSDEALNKHLDWLDKCAEEQAKEQHECVWIPDIYGKGFVGASCRCGESLVQDEVVSRLNEYEKLKRRAKALEAELAGRKLMDAGVEPLLSVMEVVPEGTLAENECLETELDNVRDAYEKLEATNADLLEALENIASVTPADIDRWGVYKTFEGINTEALKAIRKAKGE